MTWKELSDKISSMTQEEQQQDVAIWGEDFCLRKQCALEKIQKICSITSYGMSVFQKVIWRMAIWMILLQKWFMRPENITYLDDSYVRTYLRRGCRNTIP